MACYTEVHLRYRALGRGKTPAAAKTASILGPGVSEWSIMRASGPVLQVDGGPKRTQARFLGHLFFIYRKQMARPEGGLGVRNCSKAYLMLWLKTHSFSGVDKCFGLSSRDQIFAQARARKQDFWGTIFSFIENKWPGLKGGLVCVTVVRRT